VRCPTFIWIYGQLAQPGRQRESERDSPSSSLSGCFGARDHLWRPRGAALGEDGTRRSITRIRRIRRNRDEIEARPVGRYRRSAQDPAGGEWRNQRAGHLRPLGAVPALCTDAGLPAKGSMESKAQLCRPAAKSPMAPPGLVVQIAISRRHGIFLEIAAGTHPRISGKLSIVVRNSASEC
jgi:hypothetical protein